MPNLEALRSGLDVREEYETFFESAVALNHSTQNLEDDWLHFKNAVQQASHAEINIHSNWMTAETLAAIDARTAAW